MLTQSNNQLLPITESISPNMTSEQQQRIDSLLHNSKATNTIRAYQSDWNDFTTFCTLHSLTSLPAHPDTILFYLSELSQTHSFATIKRRVSSISKAHTTSNHPSPTTVQSVKELLEGIARTNGNKSTPKKALILDDLKLIIDSIDATTLTGKRDKAIILIGFALASRRSELVGISVKDLAFTNEGLDIAIYEEKTKQNVNKSIVYAHNNYCAINALKDWIEVSNIKTNAIFRSINRHNQIGERLDGRTVATIIKKYIELVGLNPDDYAGHSVRSGLATSAANAGLNDASIMKQTGHKSRGMVDRYTQEGNRYKNNASSILSTL